MVNSMTSDIDLYYELEGKRYTLNRYRVQERGLNQRQVDKIKELNVERLMVEAQLARQYIDDQICAWYKVWEQIQFDLQIAWGDKKDSTVHPAHQLMLCSCSELDIYSKLGRSSDCRLHNALANHKG